MVEVEISRAVEGSTMMTWWREEETAAHPAQVTLSGQVASSDASIRLKLPNPAFQSLLQLCRPHNFHWRAVFLRGMKYFLTFPFS